MRSWTAKPLRNLGMREIACDSALSAGAFFLTLTLSM